MTKDQLQKQVRDLIVERDRYKLWHDQRGEFIKKLQEQIEKFEKPERERLAKESREKEQWEVAFNETGSRVKVWLVQHNELAFDERSLIYYGFFSTKNLNTETVIEQAKAACRKQIARKLELKKFKEPK